MIISTVLTLLIIPVFYKIVNSFATWRRPGIKLRWPFGGLCLLFLFLPAFVSAQQTQTVSLEQAIEIAKQNHPRLKIANNAIQQAKATRGEVIEATPTSFSYSWGQLNGENKKDKELAFEQSLGSLLTPFYKNALVNRQVKTNTYYRQMVEKEITAEVKRAWAYYQYATNLCSMYRDQDKMAEELQRIGELRYQQGEITLLEKNMMTTIAADLHNRWFQAKEEEKMALAGFQWSCYSNDPIVPADSTLSLFYTGILDGNLSGAHTAYFQSQADEAKAMLRVEQSHFFPEISVGYTRQDILPLKNLNAWMIGVSFPIYFLPQKSKVKQARLTATSAQIQADANIRELRNKTLELEASLRRYNESLRYYTSSALKEADELTKAANLQLQQSETGIAEYIQSITTAREIRRGYIETVYQYNIAALEYELFK